VSPSRTLARFCLTSPISMFSPFAQPFSGVSAETRGDVTQGNIRVRVTLSEACPFSPDVSCFHVFDHRLDVFRRFRRNTGQRTCPRHVKQRLPISPDVACFHDFTLRLAIFRRFRCNTEQRTCPRHIKRRLPVCARRRPFPCFCPSLSHLQAFSL
jgi:hypothetical protein